MAVVPVYNILAVPGANIPLSLERFEKMIGRVPVSGERVTLIFMKEEKSSLRRFLSDRRERYRDGSR